MTATLTHPTARPFMVVAAAFVVAAVVALVLAISAWTRGGDGGIELDRPASPSPTTVSARTAELLEHLARTDAVISRRAAAPAELAPESRCDGAGRPC